MPSNYQQYAVTLQQMVGRIQSVKPNIPPTLAADFINDAIRTISDRKPNWTGMADSVPIYIPAIINTGTVTTAQNSAVVTGSGTGWATNDVVNTTIANAVTRPGLQTVVPASMTGIDVDTLLYLDDGSGSEEIVAVKSVTLTSFTAEFANTHSAGFTVWCSSLSGRQFRPSSYNYPRFTIKAATSATSITLDNKWVGSAITGVSFEIFKIYYTFDPGLKSFISITDPVQGIPPLQTTGSIASLDAIDPQRTSTGYPQKFLPRGVDTNGNMQYELWPKPQSERTMIARFYRQPPNLVRSSDFLPALMNPTLVFSYAAGMAMRTKVGGAEGVDPYYSPADAVFYMKQFEDQYNAMCIAEDEKNHTDVAFGSNGRAPGGADWMRSHDYDIWVGNI